jgi:uncharacterized protein (DUF983 family)
MTRDWLKLRQQAANIGRPLKCPLCGFRFAFRHLIRAGKACPHCKVPIGFSFLYRALLAVAGWAVMARVMYVGYQRNGPGWLLIGLPFALVAAIVVQTVIQRVFPPKLEAYSEGNTWLRLT